MSRLAQLAAQATSRRTALPAGHYERQLSWVGCNALVAVFEAATGARTAAEHQHLDASLFRCADCMGAT